MPRLIDPRTAAQGGDALFPRSCAASWSVDELARIEQAGGVEARLDPPQRREPGGAVEFCEQVALQLSDAMFGRDRSAKFKDMAVNEAADIFAMCAPPRSAVSPYGRLDMGVDINVAAVPDGQGADAGGSRGEPARIDRTRR